MLGSRAEAEDIVQDVWLKWHLADTHEVQTPAAWLTTLTTRTAIDRLRNVQRERDSQATGWLPEPWLDEVAPSAEELALRAAEMSYGVMLLLDRLKPDERAAFVLHEAFDCDYAEIGKILERAPASCRQIVHRARAPLQRRDPEAHARIVERLRNALQAQDRASLLELFSDAPEVVTDQPVCRAASVVAHSAAIAPTEAATHARRVPAKALAETGPSALDFAFGDWMERVTSLARQASHAELVSVDGALSIALLVEGEVVALIDVSTEGSDRGLTAAARGGARSGAATGVTTGTAAGATSHLTSDESRGPSPVYVYADGAAKIVSLRAVTSASRLEAANRLLGRAAVTEMLARIQQRSLDSIAMGRDFPVDVYA
ncbi:MAG: Sigma-24 (FecI) [uncultured Paraburkholderia sp.]|nr:MAG: Sigma-24 (FecI) [uncultured Paraburkholderia sp.]